MSYGRCAYRFVQTGAEYPGVKLASAPSAASGGRQYGILTALSRREVGAGRGLLVGVIAPKPAGTGKPPAVQGRSGWLQGLVAARNDALRKEQAALFGRLYPGFWREALELIISLCHSG